MALRLYGSPLSACTQVVLVVLKEKDLPYEFIQVKRSAVKYDTPGSFIRQTLGQVTHFENNGLNLSEIRAIARYIAIKYADHGIKLIPPSSDVVGLARLDEAISIEMCHFMPSAAGLILEKMVKPLFLHQNGDEIAATRHLATLGMKLDAYDRILSKQQYLAGDTLTLADLYHLPGGHQITAMRYALLTSPERPHVARWWEDISSRPAWQEVVKYTQLPVQ